MDAGEIAMKLQIFLAVFFFTFSVFFFSISLLLKLLRSRPWCDCSVCETYATSAWAKDFPNLCDWYTDLLRLSPTKTIHIHILNNIITANKENVEHILRKRFDNYPKGQPFSSILGDLLGKGIFNVDGDQWIFQRKIASLELGSTSVRNFALEIISCEVKNRLLPLLNTVSEVDIQDVFRRFSFDSICKISFGIDPKCLELDLPISEFAAAFDTATGISARRAAAVSPLIWRLKRLLNLGSERELRKAIRLLNVLATEVIRQRRKLKESTSSAQDLLSRFMGSIQDDTYVRDIVVSFLLAGRDTVASALTSFFYLLSDNPAVEEAILLESTGLVGGSIPSWDELREMHYTHAAVYESMRLYPPVQFDSKFAVEDDILPDGTFVKKGKRVTYHPYAMGRMEMAWGQDYLSFRPERWLSEEGKFSPESPYKYPVFQGGSRVCIGKEMAIMEVMCVIVSVVREFKVRTVCSGTPLKFAPGLTATVRGGLQVTVSPRKKELLQGR